MPKKLTMDDMIWIDSKDVMAIKRDSIVVHHNFDVWESSPNVKRTLSDKGER